ncbi:flagellar biosynthetic protein FliO [Oscillospiraceae bacterium 44-34]
MPIPQILSVLGMLAVVLLVLTGAFLFTRWAGRNLGGGFAGLGGGRRIEVLDRTGLGKDQAILLVRAGGRYLLLGSAPGGLALLAELTREEGEEWETPASPGGPEEKRPPEFLALLQRLREKK